MKPASLVTRVREVLHRRAIVEINGESVRLTEQESQLELIGLPKDEDVTVIDMDELGEMKGVRGKFRRKCDFLVLLRKGDADVAVFVELKKTLTEEDRALDQLRRSPPYLAYLRTLCGIEFECATDLRRPLTVLYLAVGERTTPYFSKGRVSDPQDFSKKKHRGITVQRFIGNQLHFARVRALAA